MSQPLSSNLFSVNSAAFRIMFHTTGHEGSHIFLPMNDVEVPNFPFTRLKPETL